LAPRLRCAGSCIIRFANIITTPPFRVVDSYLRLFFVLFTPPLTLRIFVASFLGFSTGDSFFISWHLLSLSCFFFCSMNEYGRFPFFLGFLNTVFLVFSILFPPLFAFSVFHDPALALHSHLLPSPSKEPVHPFSPALGRRWLLFFFLFNGHTMSALFKGYLFLYQ